MNRNVNVFIGVILCALLCGCFVWLFSVSEEDTWKPNEIYDQLHATSYSASYTNVTYSVSSTGGLALTMSPSSALRRRAVSSYAGAYSGAASSPHRLITSSPLASSPLTYGAAPGAGLYTTSSAEIKSFGGGGNGGAAMSYSQSPIANRQSPITPHTETVIVNIQGDEPFVDASQLQALMACFDSPDTQIATLVKPFSEKDSYETLANPNSPKVLLNKEGEAMYFSRSVVPYLRNVPQDEYLQHHTFYKHIGIYAYRRDVLTQLAALEPTLLEKAESLEQLRWLENGYKIKVATCNITSIGIDTPEDLENAKKIINLI